jgi:hypothetical protein
VMWRYHILSHIKNRIKRKNKKFHIWIDSFKENYWNDTN